jgi:hypothetical protein
MDWATAIPPIGQFDAALDRSASLGAIAAEVVCLLWQR